MSELLFCSLLIFFFKSLNTKFRYNKQQRILFCYASSDILVIELFLKQRHSLSPCDRMYTDCSSAQFNSKRRKYKSTKYYTCKEGDKYDMQFYTHNNTCIHAYMHLCMSMYAWLCACMHGMYFCLHALLYAWFFACMHAYTNACMHACICKCMHG